MIWGGEFVDLFGLGLGAIANAPLAYLDPGSGSLPLQGLVGGIAALLFTIKSYWGQITTFFRRDGAQGSPTDGPER